MPPTSKSRLLAAAAAAIALPGFLAAVAARQTGRHIDNAVPDVARPLPLSAVRLAGGPLKRAQDLDAAYLLALDPDRMLAFYRTRAGLEPKAPPYDGWDGDGRNLTGHIAGHHLSAVSLMWAATGDRRFKDRADYMVGELKLAQDKNGDGYLGALARGREAFDEVANGSIRSASFDLNGLWSPWYTFHKTFAGLRDAYRHTGNAAALDVEVKFAEWAEKIVSRLTDAQLQQMLNTEFGGMPEVAADLYADTGDRRWLALSHKFDHRAVRDPLARGEDRLAGLHGNTQVPKLLGYLARYTYTGDRDDGAAAAFFWDRVVNHHTFATGGHGKDEYFREPDTLSHIVDGRTAETCNVYNMLKLTRRLFALKPDVKYAEFEERALFNHILGSIDAGEGAMCYMVPVGHGVRREYQDMSHSFTCCVGSGMESHALHGDGIYYESGDRLWVNLYVPSSATWYAAGARIDMDTTFPEGGSTTLKVTLRRPTTFTIAMRRPSWAGEGFRVDVNGAAVKDLPGQGSYVEVKRLWKTGDVVRLSLPKTLRLEPTDDRRRAAILWGPLVLAGDLGPEGPRGREGSAPPQESPVLVALNRPINDWIKPVAGKPGMFKTAGVGRDRDVELLPFYRLHRRAYTAYWDLFTPQDFEKRLTARAAERERIRRLEKTSIAFVAPGEQSAEQTVNQRGEETSIVRVDGRSGRRAARWFSYDLAIDASGPLALVATYHSDTRRAKAFEILIDGQRVGEQALPESSEARFFDVEYRIPPELVRGKQRVTVRFQTAGTEAGPVFGIRIVRAND